MALTVGEIEATLRLRDDMSRQLQQARANISAFGSAVSDSFYRTAASTKALLDEQNQFNMLANRFSGMDITKKADMYADAVAHAGGRLMLTKNEQAEVNRVMTEAVAKYEAMGEKAPREIERLANATQGAVERTQALHTQLSQLGMGLTRIGTLMTAAITVPIVGAATAAIHFGSDFEANLVKVQTLAGAGKEEMGGFKKSIMDLAPAVGIGPAELAKGLFVVRSEGYKGAEAMNILEIASKGVAMGMGDSFTVTRTLVTTLKAFQQQGLTAAEAMDTLVATVQQGDMPIDALAGSLGRVNAIAAALNIPFSEVGAAIATFTRVGVSADLAVTGLRAVLVGLEMPTSKAGKAITEMYGSVQNLRNEIQEKGLARVLVEMIEKTKGNADALRELFPNVRALTQALSNAKSQGKDYLEVADKIRHAHEQGLGAKGFAATTETLAFQWEQLKVKAEELAIRLGDQLLPRIKDAMPLFDRLVGWAGSAIGFFGKLPEPVQLTALAVAGLLAALGPLLVIAGQAIHAAAGLVTILGAEGVAGASAAAATAIGTALVGALALVVVPAALYEIYSLLKNIAGLRRDVKQWERDDKSLADTMRNEVATAVQMAGHEFKNYAEAHDYLRQKSMQLREQVVQGTKDLMQGGIVVKSLIDPTLAHAAAVNKQSDGMAYLAKMNQQFADDMKKLSPAEKAAIVDAHKHGTELKELADHFHVSSESLERMVKEQGEGAKAGKAHADALKRTLEAVAPLTEAEKKRVDQLSMLEMSEGDIVKAMGVSEAAVRRYLTAKKHLAEVDKEAIAAAKDFAQNQLKFLEQNTKYILEDLKALQKYRNEEQLLGKTGVEAALIGIEQQRQAELSSIDVRHARGSQLWTDLTAAANRHFDHLRDVATHTAGTLEERMFAQGVFTRAQLGETAKAARIDFEQIQGDAHYSAAQVQAAWQRWHEADEAYRARMVTGWKRDTLLIADLLVQLGTIGAGTFAMIAGAAGAAIHGIQQGAEAHKQLEAMRQKYQDGETSGMEVAMAYATTVVSGFQEMAAATDNVSRAKAALGGLATGMKYGMAIAGPWGAAIGGAVGFVVGLFRHNETRSVMKDVGKTWGTEISEALAKEIADTEKKYHVSRHIAELLNISKIVEEAGGLTSKNFDRFVGQAVGLIDVVRKGGKDAGAALSSLDGFFGQMVDHMNTSMNGLADRTMVNFINRVRQSGVEVKSMTAFISAQMEKVATGFNAVAAGFAAPFMAAINISEDASGSTDKLYEKQKKLIAQIKDLEEKDQLTHQQENQLRKDREDLLVVTYQLGRANGEWAKAQEELSKTLPQLQAGFDRLGRVAVAAFSAALASGKPLVQVLRDMGPGLDTLTKVMDTFGLTASDTFAELLAFRRFVHDNEELANSIDGVNQMMIGLNNAGMLTQDTFTDLTATALDTFNKIVDGGMSGDQAMRLMQPTLQTIWQLEKEFGFTVDDATQKLVDQAVKAGIVGEKHKDIMHQVADAITRVGDILAIVFKDKLPADMQYTADAASNIRDRIREIPNSVDTHVNVHYTHDGDDPSGGHEPGGVAGPHGTPHHGTGGRFTRPHRAIVGDRPETIVPDAYIGDLAAAISARGGAGGGDTVLHTQVVLDGRVIDERIERVSARAINSGRNTVGTRNVKKRTY